MAKTMVFPTTFNTQQQHQILLSTILCKYHHPSSLLSFLRSTTNAKPSSTEHEIHSLKILKCISSSCSREFGSGVSPLRSIDKRVERKAKISSVVEEQHRKASHVRRKREMGLGFSSLSSRDERVEMKTKKGDVRPIVDESLTEISDKMAKSSTKVKGDGQMAEKGVKRKFKKHKMEDRDSQLRGFDMFSKRGDFLGAISLYDWLQTKGIELKQYHYTVLLYLCSSAASGVVLPAKSGKAIRSVGKTDFNNEPSVNPVSLSEIGDMGNGNNNDMVTSSVSVNGFVPVGTGENESMEGIEVIGDQGDCKIQINEDVQRYALKRGFEIYEKICSDKIPLNEAILTSVARMEASMGDAMMAFEIVKKMKELGIKCRLRSYGPALFTFCNGGDYDKAFMVEEHMLENGVYPEEPELEALLRVSIGAGSSDKVYYILHKLRKDVRQVSLPTAQSIEAWFQSTKASRVGKQKWDEQLIMKSMEDGGGGWHGRGWLGRGKWTTKCTLVGSDGICKGCGEKLVIIDLDPVETENFAKSVVSIATARERNSSFHNFQKWLDCYGPFEAVVDAANVGLYSRRNFAPSRVNAIVNAIRQKLPSKKSPLIIVHNQRIQGRRMEKPKNKIYLEKWKVADALYTTPTGSNDDWYWLYAAIKFNCLLVTNDLMRDHIFQLLGNDFFPIWKERHQVRFGFPNGNVELHMPPPCSLVIQESDKGHWHIPIMSEHFSEGERIWLCVTRANAKRKCSPTGPKEAKSDNDEEYFNKHGQESRKMKFNKVGRKMHPNTQHPKEDHRSLRSILSSSVAANHQNLVSEIEAAEILGGCIIDFQI